MPETQSPPPPEKEDVKPQEPLRKASYTGFNTPSFPFEVLTKSHPDTDSAKKSSAPDDFFPINLYHHRRDPGPAQELLDDDLIGNVEPNNPTPGDIINANNNDERASQLLHDYLTAALQKLGYSFTTPDSDQEKK